MKISSYTVSALLSWDVSKLFVMLMVTLVWCILPAIVVTISLIVSEFRGVGWALAVGMCLAAVFAKWQFYLSVGWLMALYDSGPENYDSKGNWVYTPETFIEIWHVPR